MTLLGNSWAAAGAGGGGGGGGTAPLDGTGAALGSSSLGGHTFPEAKSSIREVAASRLVLDGEPVENAFPIEDAPFDNGCKRVKTTS